MPKINNKTSHTEKKAGSSGRKENSRQYGTGAPAAGKKQKKASNRKKQLLIFELGVFLLLLIIVFLFVRSRRQSTGTAGSTAEGEAYIAAETAKDPSAVQSAIQEAEQAAGLTAADDTADISDTGADSQEVTDSQSSAADSSGAQSSGVDPAVLQEQAAPLYAEIESLSVPELTEEQLADYQQRYADTVVVGDSMAQAVYEYGLLDGNHVYFERGASISALGDQVDEAMSMLPVNVVFFTGLNDTDYFDDPNAYAAAYQEKVNQVLSANPSAHVYICSMTPPSDALAAAREDLARSPEYDAALQTLCASSSATYIDLNWMVKQELYLEDGIHFNSSFYTVWLQYAAMNLGI